MSARQDAPESTGTTPQPAYNAGTPRNRRKGFTPLRKALAATAAAAFLFGGAAFASHGFTKNPVDAFASQTHSSQASNGSLTGHTSGGKRGLTSNAAMAVPVVITEPVKVPVSVQHPVAEHYGTVTIPRLGADWTHYLVEGASDAQLDLPGTNDLNAVENFETAVGHAPKTQNLGELGNVVIEAHRTPNTFGRLDTLELGDAVSITESGTGTVYTYAVTQTIKELPFKTDDEKDKAWGALDPIPFDRNSVFDENHPAKTLPTRRLLTMTSCGLDEATTHYFRVYVQAELQSVTPGTAVK